MAVTEEEFYKMMEFPLTTKFENIPIHLPNTMIRTNNQVTSEEQKILESGHKYFLNEV
jgi:hypothetical protein